MLKANRAAARRHWPYALLACLAFAASRSPAQDGGTFSSATAAFAAGDYQQALTLFEAARDEGVDGPAIQYNIGVCQYRVGAYAAAATTFTALRDRFPAFAAVADYNQGLALLALAERDAARAAFERAQRSEDETLRSLAALALASLTRAPAPPPARWVGVFETAVGHDDNVALVDELTLPTSASASSAFEELLGYAGYRFGPDARARVGASGYVVRYADAPQFDQAVLRIDAALAWPMGTWHLEAGSHLGRTELDGDGFERSLGFDLRAARPLTTGLAFEARFAYDDIDAASSRFAAIGGTRERLRVGLDNRGDRHRFRIGYELETNDRAAGSVSPERQRLVAQLEHSLGARWSVEATLARRASRYDELATPREERLTESAAAARRRLPRGWVVSAEYRLADNHSSAPEFSYRSRRVGLGVGRTF
jgi:tetratricopeptide (TPR) repeat protein